MNEELKRHVESCDECRQAGGWTSSFCPVGQALVRKELAEIQIQSGLGLL